MLCRNIQDPPENAKTPKLNKLGGQEWNKTKSRVKGAVKNIAKELVELYAVRQEKEGYVCRTGYRMAKGI